MSIKSKESLLKMLPKIFMIKSSRDSRLGVILKYENGICTVKMENINRLLKFDLETLCSNFSFIFSKTEGVSSWYDIKYRRAEIHGLYKEVDSYNATIILFESFFRMNMKINNHEIFCNLEKLRNFYKNQNKKVKA